MFFIRSFFAAVLLCAASLPAAADVDGLTVQDVVMINNALSQMNCAPTIIRDGAKETQVCVPYKISAGLTWAIAANKRRAEGVIAIYDKVRNEAVVAAEKKPDGELTPGALAQFNLDDRKWREAPAGVKLLPLPRAEIEAMNLQPSILSALIPIIPGAE